MTEGDTRPDPQSPGEITDEHFAEDENIEDNFDESDETMPVKYSISAYGADYPVDGLVKRIQVGDIYVPRFQRGYIWPLPKASRFIESLLLGLPVPGIFLSKERDTRKLLVIDGQQRLRTLQYFYKGAIPERKQQFALTNLRSQFDGATYETLSEEDRRRLDDSILHAIIVKQDEPSDDDSSIYHIFERLNTGGVLLNPQEIRACVYHGPFNDLLRALNANANWRTVFGPVNKRMRDQELILRFLALYSRHENYRRPMKEFLNQFMGANRDLGGDLKQRLNGTFTEAIAVAREALGDRAFRPVRALNAAVFDAVLVGIAKRLDAGAVRESEELREEYEALLESEDFDSLTSVRTTDDVTVRERVRLAIDAFRGVA